MASNTETARSTVILDGKQAGEELKELKQKAKDLRAQLKELKIAGDSEGYEAKKRELDGLKRSMDQAKKSTYDFDQIMKNLSGSSMKELVRVQNTLQAEIRNSTRNTREEVEALKAKGEQLKKVKAEIEKVRTEMLGMNNNQSFFSKMADGFNRYFTIVTAFVATFSGVIFSFKKAVDAYNEFEKTVDNLSALTGLAGDELQYLSDQAKELSTSTIEGSIRITQSAQDIVNAYTKVGSARPELLKNKEALNAVTQDAIILSEASNTELQPAIEGLTMVLNQFNLPATESRRVINALAAGSKVGAGEIPYLTSAVEKSGTVAADAKISIETLIGTIETLAPRISEPEIAGRTLKGVLLDLQKGAEDTNPAIVGMEKALDNLAAKNLSTVELLKMFGTENITTAKILINNREELKNYTAAVTDTNVAIEQATINTDNNASRLDQAKNKFHNVVIYLGEKLAPIMTTSTNSVTYFIKGLVVLIDTFRVWGPIIAGALASLTAYTLVVKGAILWKKLYEAIIWRVMLAQEALSKSQKASGWGLLIAAIAGAITWLATYSKKLKETEEVTRSLARAQQTYSDRLAEEQATLDIYFDRLKKTNAGSAERKYLIDEINGKYGTTLKNLEDENEFLKQIDTTYRQIMDSIKAKAMLEAKSSELVELYKKRAEIQKQIKAYDENVAAASANYTMNQAGLTQEQIEAQKALYETMKQTGAIRSEGQKQYQKEMETVNKQIQAVSELTIEEQALIKTKNEGSATSEKNKEKEKDAYEKLTAAIAEQEALLRAQIAEGDPNIQATIDRINVLKAEKDQIDSVYNAYMDLLQLPKSESLDDLIKWAEEQDNMDTAKLLHEMDIIIKKNKKLGDSYIDAEEKKKKAAEETIELRKKQIASSFEAGAAAVEEAKTVEEAGKAVLNSIRQQIKAAIAEAIAKSVAEALISVPFPWNIALATAAGAAASLLFETIIPQFGTGRYEVTGAQDGKRYQAEWAGVPVTGLYTRPSLIAETGSEIIIDPYRTRNIMMNYPYLLEAIKSVPQHATGTVPAGQGQMMFPAELTAVLIQLSDQLGKGIRAKMVYSEFQDIKDRVDSIENSVKTR